MTGTSTSSHRSSGHRNVIASFGPRQHGTGVEAAAPFAHVGEPQDRVGQIVVGAKLECVDTGIRESRAQRLLAILGGLDEALAEAAIVRVDEELLASLGVLHRQKTEIG